MKNRNLVQRNFLVYIILILATVFLGCAKEKPISREEPSNGWAGSPDNPQAKPFEYFYMKSTGRASEKAIKTKSKAMMEVTCIDSATYSRKVDLARSIVFKSGILADCNSMCGCSGCIENLDDFSEVRISIVELVACPTDIYNPALSELFKEIIGKVNVNYTDCKPTASTIRNFPRSEWRECECAVYTRIPGGRKSVWEKCINLEKRFGIKN